MDEGKRARAVCLFAVVLEHFWSNKYTSDDYGAPEHQSVATNTSGSKAVSVL